MFKQILQSRWFTLLMVIFLAFMLTSLVKLEPSITAVRKEVKNLDQKIAELEKTNLELERLGGYFKSPSYLERQARLKLNYKKPDEKVVYVYTKEQPENIQKEDKNSDSGPLDYLKKIFGFLFLN